MSDTRAVDEAVEKVILLKNPPGGNKRPMSDKEFHEAKEDAFRTVKNAEATKRHRIMEEKFHERALKSPAKKIKKKAYKR